MPNSKRKRVAIIVICCLIAALILSDLWYPLVFGGLTKNAYALLSPDAPTADLPPQVSITFDGSAATFRKGNSDYDTFLSLLRTAKSDDASLAAGPYPSFTTRERCGELAIPYHFIPFHFRLYRSNANHNYLWIGLPHISGIPGTTYPIILDDGRLLQFVQNAATKQRNEGH